MPTSDSKTPATGASPGLVWLARILCWFCWVGVAFTAFTALAALFDMLPGWMNRGGDNAPALLSSAVTVDDPSAPDATAQMQGDPLLRLAALIPASLFIWALLSARASFAGIGRGDFFGRRTTGGLRNFAIAVLLYLTAGPVATTIAKVLYATRFEHGSFSISVNLNPITVLILVFAGAVAIVSSVMARAARIADENEQFV